MATLTPPTENGNATRTLIDELLAEQRDLTAVERFSRWHENHNGENHSLNYKNLIPLNSPRPGEQYAFEVDLDKCSGCKACVAGCHSMNGLDENETWRGVGLLISENSSPTNHFQQHVTTACHHCVEPACAEGCPVLAYDKDPATGIVRHLDDQCIGCQYCTLMCPYDVPKYSKSRGIVRKCDMCHQRLAHGEAPACVQSCPNEAIKITIVKQSEVVNRWGETPSSPDFEKSNATNNWLPDSPNPQITFPTTRYISKRDLNFLRAADHNAPRLDHPHWPLIAMLVFTQAAVGMFLAAMFVQSPEAKFLDLAAFAVLNLGLLAAPLHLGQPLKAWRAFLGWRKSWLSREIIIFNLFAPLAASATAIVWLPFLAQRFPKLDELLQKIPAIVPPLEKLQLPLTITAALVGFGCVAVSAMVYVATKRSWWSPRHSFGAFSGTTFLLGATFASGIFGWLGDFSHARNFAIAALAVRTALFGWRRLEIYSAAKNSSSDIHLNARAIRELLPWTPGMRLALFIISTIFGLLAITNVANATAVWASVAALTTLVSEILVRWIFFVASANRKMPGGIEA